MYCLFTLIAPSGSPAAVHISARIKHEQGASSEGFKTTVQPAAMAGITFQIPYYACCDDFEYNKELICKKIIKQLSP